MTTPPLPDDLVRYLAKRDRLHADNVQRALNALSPRERELLREAAVMGYVRGSIYGSLYGRDARVPGDQVIVEEVVDACLALSYLYPVINSVAGRTEEEQ